MRNSREYQRRYRRPEGAAAFLSDHLDRSALRTLFVIAPLWLAVFAGVSVGAFQLIVNAFCCHFLGLPFHFYTYSSFGTVAAIATLLCGRSADEGLGSVLLLGAIIATLVCWYLFRTDYDLE